MKTKILNFLLLSAVALSLQACATPCSSTNPVCIEKQKSEYARPFYIPDVDQN